MNRRQKIIISVTGIFLVLLILVGLTYAYFLTQIQGNEEERSITVTTANLVLEYSDGNGILETDKLEPSNDFIQFKDSEGNSVPSKIFTVTNKGNATVEGYKVYLEKVQNQLVRKDDLVYTLTCKAYTNYGKGTQAEVESGCNGVSTETTFPDVITSIVSNDINIGETHVYELKVKYKEMGVDQSVDMNKLITAKINIYDATTKFLAREIIDNATSTATVAYNKTLYIDPSLQDGTTYTIPAETKNNEDERIITYTFDDYGTSYYFRGNIEDNYLNFSNMCWKIVRIEGDGSVKLILEDRDQLCNSRDTAGNLNLDRNWNDSKNYTFGYKKELVPLGYYAFKVDFFNYTSTDGLQHSFKTFQTSKLTSIDIEKLKVDEWCFDNNTTDVNGNEIYDAYTRIYTNKKPSLKCTGIKLTKYKDETDMYVGTLTVDEMSLAGAPSANYYLKPTDERNCTFWSISPALYSEMSGADLTFVIDCDGSLAIVPVDNYSTFDSRVAITLKPGIMIVKGNGTQENPYVID